MPRPPPYSPLSPPPPLSPSPGSGLWHGMGFPPNGSPCYRGKPIPCHRDRKSTRLNSSHIPLSRMPSFYSNAAPPPLLSPLSPPAPLPISWIWAVARDGLPAEWLALLPREAHPVPQRSEEHTFELQSHSFISYAVFLF